MDVIMREWSERPGADVAPGSRRSRLRDGSAWWRYARHLAEMVVAMVAGMIVLGLAVDALGTPPGYADLLVHSAWMGVAMSAPMLAWMRFKGHPWTDGAEMTAAMLVPMFALVLPVTMQMGIPGLSVRSLPALAHLAMIAGMAALMVYRWDRYAGGRHCH
jgi:hypothetical protein